MFACQLKHYSMMYLVITDYYPAQKSHREPECLGVTRPEHWHVPEQEVLTHSTGVPDQSFLVGFSEGC